MATNPAAMPDDEATDATTQAPEPNEPPETPAEESGEHAENEICVSLDALAQPGEDDQMETPQVGDKVQCSVEGEVSRIEGDKAYVTMSSVNGQEVKPPTEGPSDSDQLNELQGMAQNMPERY